MKVPGVLAVLTAEELIADGIGTLHTSVKRKLRDGSPMPEPPFRLLAHRAVRFVGDAVAAIVAETLAAAQEGAEQVSVEYDELPGVTDAVAAVQQGVPAVWPDDAPDNICFVFEQGDRAAVAAAFARADHVTKLDFRVSRVSANSLEPLNALAIFDSADGRYTLFNGTQRNAPYRGAGRPEATYALERVIDVAARELQIDRVELRKRNLISAEAMPFKTGLVFTYDSGDFLANMELALGAADWGGFERRRAQSASRGYLRGRGIVNAIEIAGGPFRNPNEEAADLRFDANGDLTVLLGTHNHGQGHETAFRQIAVSLLGLHPDHVRIASGDTDLIAHGRGTFGSRSLMVGGAAFVRASEKILARARQIAAQCLEAGEADIEFDAGTFRVAGTDRAIRIEEVARRSHVPASVPDQAEYGLAASAIVTPHEASFPNGCHICEVEIDPETGETKILSYVVVDDVGTVINPLLVKGQIHGGIAQGLGQICGEEIVYDKSNGQMLTASFMDYPMPRAEDVPPINVISNPTPTASNPLEIGRASCRERV